MYIHWTHYYLPKAFGALSFLFNPIFLHLVISDRQTNIGNYKYLLVSFSLFDMAYSGVDMLVPIASHGIRSAFTVYLTDGVFVENVRVGQFALSIRCGFVGLSYGILAIHFIYRYSLLFNTPISYTVRTPSGLCYLFLFSITHGVVWTIVCELFLYSDNETNAYVFESFSNVYGESSYKIPLLVAIYSEVSESLKCRSWTGVLILNGISCYAISLYITLGTRIIQKIGECENLSNITKKLYKRLLKALVVQTSIPIAITFAPCLAAWYAPMFQINLGMWINYTGVIANAAFPFLDPLTIVFLLPNYRKKFLMLVRLNNCCVSLPTENVTSIRPTPRYSPNEMRSFHLNQL